jgi:hypothetical protein
MLGSSNFPFLHSPPEKKTGTWLKGGSITKKKRRRTWTVTRKLKIVSETLPSYRRLLPLA